MYKTHIIVDFEMNPIAKNNKEIRQVLRNEIIQIGAVKLNEKYELVDKFVCYVCPKYNDNVSTFITGLTGIKTIDVYKADSFESALKRFSKWIGEEVETRIYSWSYSDLSQLKAECEFKEIIFPENMHRWLDLQAIYQRLTGLSKMKQKIALKRAAEQFGIKVDKKKVHTALYDAELATEILLPILNGTYSEQVKLLQSANTSEPEPMTQSLGEAYSGLFQQLMQQIQPESAGEK